MFEAIASAPMRMRARSSLLDPVRSLGEPASQCQTHGEGRGVCCGRLPEPDFRGKHRAVSQTHFAPEAMLACVSHASAQHRTQQLRLI